MIELYYSDIFADVEKHGYRCVFRHALGDIWKFISCSLSAKDSEYYENVSKKST